MSIASIGNHMTHAISGNSPVTNHINNPLLHSSTNDGDADDGVGAATASRPTVNLSGQSVGQHINVTA